MKPSEFYLKYWRVIDSNGETKPVSLTETDAKIMDMAHELGIEPYIIVRTRKGIRYELNPQLKHFLNID